MITYKTKDLGLDVIRVGKQHWKLDYADADIEELADSISRFGQLNPIVVRPVGKGKSTYELLAGARRLEALKKTGTKTARCSVVTSKCDDRTAALISLTENLHMRRLPEHDFREGLTRYRELLQNELTKEAAAQMERQGVSQKALAGRPKSNSSKVLEKAAGDVGVDTRTARDAIKRAENLSNLALTALDSGSITLGQANLLANIPREDQPRELGLMMKESTGESTQRLLIKDDKNPTDTAGKLLRRVIGTAAKLREETKRFMDYIDNKPIDYTTLRGDGLSELRKCANSVLDLVGFVESD
jgi:ParB/RepB/Spo0J family partition protein